MFRSEAQVALDDLQLACRHAAGLYEEDAAIIGNAPLAELFRELGAQRSRMADRLERQQRRLGDLPSVPDEDRETLTHLKDRLQAQLSRDEYRTLLDNRLQTEHELEYLVDRALTQELPAPARSLLEDVRRQVELGRRRLRAALGAL